MSYFDTTPLGQLIQRFSSDLDQVRRASQSP
jgi:ABC-type multidrug transport system fused ATPase/permease subunit